MESREDHLRRLEEQNRDLLRRVERLEAAVGVSVEPWTPAREPVDVPAVDVAPRPSLEARIGTRWVAAAGAAVLLLGTIFLLKLAFDRGWIGPWARLMLGWIGGSVLWVGGEALRRRVQDVYGQVVAAAGSSIVFATTWVAFWLPGYQALTGLSDAAGGVALALVALAAVAHGAILRGPVLAGTALGLSHLVGASVDDVQTVAMTGTAVLAIGLAAAAGWRRWPWLLISAQSLHLSLVFHAAFGNEPLWAAAASLSLVAASIVATQRQQTWASAPAALLWLGASLSLGVATWEYWVDFDRVGWVILALALGALAATRLPQGQGGSAGAAILLGVMWPWIQFDQPWPLAIWGLQLAALAALLGWRRSLLLRAATLTLGIWLALSVIAAGFEGAPVSARWLLGLALACAGLWVAWWVTREEHSLGRAILVLALVAPLATAAAFRDDPLVTLLWAMEAALALGVGAAIKNPDLRFGGLGVIGLVLARIVLIDLANVDPILRILAFLATGGLLLGIGFAYARFLGTTDES